MEMSRNVLNIKNQIWKKSFVYAKDFFIILKSDHKTKKHILHFLPHRQF